MIREIEAERAAALATDPHHDTGRQIEALCRIRGIGETSATVLAREVLYRSFANRRQLASYVGLAPMPYQSGGMDRRDRRISRAGNPRARTAIIQLAWPSGCVTSRAARWPRGFARASACWPGAHGGSPSSRWRASC